MSANIISVKINKTIEHHMMSVDGNSATLCGLDGGLVSTSLMQTVVKTPPGAKINCQQCKMIFEITRKYRKDDFV